ncbi:MAG: phosphoribosyltransferase family protein [Rubripirellula sp.]|nr:phosphoribosyltransferase family protein [Rubripirellula sp.]
MVLEEQLARVAASIDQHVRASKGFEEESWINPLTPVDCVSAFAMASMLTEENRFDQLVAVAPEGHVYGYFFEQLGNSILTVHVDYPPRRCEVLDNLSGIRDQRVLILEDDVASGTTLRLVIAELKQHRPASIDLYLGRPKESQVIEFVDVAISTIYLAEDHLDPSDRGNDEARFIQFFNRA